MDIEAGLVLLQLKIMGLLVQALDFLPASPSTSILNTTEQHCLLQACFKDIVLDKTVHDFQLAQQAATKNRYQGRFGSFFHASEMFRTGLHTAILVLSAIALVHADSPAHAVPR